MILSSVSEILLRIVARINVGSISDFLFQCSSVLLGLLQFVSTVFKKKNQQPKNNKKTPQNNQTISFEESRKGGAGNNQTGRKIIPLICSCNKICQGEKEKNNFFCFNCLGGFLSAA